MSIDVFEQLEESGTFEIIVSRARVQALKAGLNGDTGIKSPDYKY